MKGLLHTRKPSWTAFRPRLTMSGLPASGKPRGGGSTCSGSSSSSSEPRSPRAHRARRVHVQSTALLLQLLAFLRQYITLCMEHRTHTHTHSHTITDKRIKIKTYNHEPVHRGHATPYRSSLSFSLCFCLSLSRSCLSSLIFFLRAACASFAGSRAEQPLGV